MIIKYYKGYIDIETIKENVKTTKLGTTAYNIIEYAKKIGFESYGMKVNLNENIILPCIAHTTINNSYNHFVVIYKIDKKNNIVHINDPSNKKNKYTFEQFNSIFNNIIIVLYPIHIIPNNPKYKLKYFIKDIARDSKTELIQLTIISVFITVFSIIISFYFQSMVENIDHKKTIFLVASIFLIIYLFKIISDYLRNKILILINEKIELNLKFNTFKQIILLPYHYYRNHTTGELVSRISDLDIVRTIISKLFINIFIDLPLTLISLIIMLILNETLFFISIIILLLYLVITILYRNTFETYVEETQNKKASYLSFMVESINGFETIKGCNKEKQTISKFEKKLINYLEHVFKFEHVFNNQFLLKEFINNIGFLVIIMVGILLVQEEVISLGILLSFNTLFTYFLTPIKNIIDSDINIKQAVNSINKIMTLYKKNEKEYIVNKSFKGDIKIKKLTYELDNKIVLNDVNLEIKEGAKVLMCGQSGSGKSTLCKLLKKYYSVAKNMIFINNIDITHYKKSDIIYIGQDEILYTDTIFNNIGKNEEISKLCLVDEIANKLSLGYNTLVEEDGFNFSGGQKQRMFLARGLNNKFNILIIDEGFSQMDPNMERIILKNIFKKYKNKTIIIVSHRLDNIDLFDQMIRLEEGKVITDESRNIW